MTSCHSKHESQTIFTSPAFSELIHQELLIPAHHCSVNKIIIISWRLLIKVESQGIVILLAQHQISLTVVTGGGVEGVICYRLSALFTCNFNSSYCKHVLSFQTDEGSLSKLSLRALLYYLLNTKYL